MVSMEVIIERVCGMDVHKNNITACIMTPQRKGDSNIFYKNGVFNSTGGLD
jgi:hypothetical protein